LKIIGALAYDITKVSLNYVQEAHSFESVTEYDMPMSSYTVCSDVIWLETVGRCLVYKDKTNEMLELNGFAAVIFSEIAGSFESVTLASLSALAEQAKSHSRIDSEDNVEEVVATLVAQLSALDVICKLSN
jgi:hypothetical protein